MTKSSSYRETPVKPSKIIAGTHLYVYRQTPQVLRALRKGFTHHGIYVGGGKVVHFAGPIPEYRQARKMRIRIDDFETFAGSRDVYCWNYNFYEGKMYSHNEIVERALEHVGEGKYNLVVKNCEHFASWCVTGKSMAFQIFLPVQKVARLAKPWKFGQ